MVQQATERAWRSFESFDAARPFRPWFLRIVANSARNDRRARGRRAHLEVRAAHAGMAQEAVTPEEAAVSDVDRQRVVAALNQLDGDDRLVIALRWFEQLTEAEMVDTLDVPAGTVKSAVVTSDGPSARGARGGRSGPWLTRSRTPASRRSS